jgi:hypothetical protein
MSSHDLAQLRHSSAQAFIVLSSLKVSQVAAQRLQASAHKLQADLDRSDPRVMKSALNLQVAMQSSIAFM